MTLGTKRAQSREGRDRRLAAELAALLLDSEDGEDAAPARGQPKPRRRRPDLAGEHAAANRVVLEARLAGDAGLEREARREAALTGAAVLNAAHRKAHLRSA